MGSMTARRLLLALGSLWDLVRFFLVISLLLLVVRSAGAGGAPLAAWLLLAGTGNLLLPVAGLMLALFPDRYASLLPLVRLGKALSVFSFVLVLASGSLRAAAAAPLLHLGGRAVPGSVLALLVFALDVVLLVLLLLPPRAPGSAAEAGAGAGMEEAR
jgi:hypothetical protein